MKQHNEKTVYINKKQVCPKCGSDKKVWHDYLKQYSKNNVKGILMYFNLTIEKENSLDGKEHRLDIDFDVCAECNTLYPYRIYMK